MPSIDEFIPVLQVAIGPVILISGVGLLLLTMTNRLARVIDRARVIVQALGQAEGEMHAVYRRELDVLCHRARVIRLAIVFATLSALSAALLVIALFFVALFGLDLIWLISLLFVGTMLCLVAALVVFLVDLNQSLAALWIEMGQATRQSPKT